MLRVVPSPIDEFIARNTPPLTSATELIDLAHELATSIDRARTARLVAHAIAHTTGSVCSAVYLADGDGSLRLKGLSGVVPSRRLQPAPPVVEAAQSGGCVAVAEKAELAGSFSFLETPAFAAAVPISSWDSRFGAVLVCGRADAEGDDLLRFASSVADLAAAALANAERLTAGSTEARRDGLTGLWNHRAFHEHLDAALADGVAAEQEVALVLFDLDDFKRINDREGHLVGDRVLKEVARLTLGVLRSGEEAFRTGGEEFAVVVSGGRETGKRVAERLRKALAGKRRGQDIPSISAGVAAFPADAGEKEALIHKADLALYAAKERGKDLVVCYHELLRSETRQAHHELHRLREEEWWRKVLGMGSVRRALMHDAEPGSGPKEVAVLAERVALQLGLSELEIRAVVIGALLVELSKLRIPESVRRKPGPLSEHDWGLVRESAEVTAAAIAPIGCLEDVLGVVRGYHERWEGSGYPAGLAGTEIPLGARIVAVCDAYCAMTSGRSWRPARTKARAVLELKEHAGTHFDPACVEALLEALGEARAQRPSGLRVASAG